MSDFPEGSLWSWIAGHWYFPGMTFIGIEIGGTKLQLVAGDAGGRIIDRRRLAVVSAEGGEGIRRQIAAALPGLMAAHGPAAIGVGFGGPVDWRTGKICCSHQVAGWHEFGLGEWLARFCRNRWFSAGVSTKASG